MTARSVLALDTSSQLQSRRPPAPAPVRQPRLLCATDFSQGALRAVTRAVAMADQLDARLILLHVAAVDEGKDAAAPGAARIKLQLRSIQSLVRQQPEIRVHAGDYLSTIAVVAEECGAELILLGTGTWKPLVSLTAAAAEKLAALAGRPVLVVRRNSHSPYGSVLVAAEQSTGFDRVLRTTASLRLLESDSVTIIHGFESPYRGPLYAAGFDPQARKRNIEEWELAARRRLLQNLDAAGVSADQFRLVFAQSRSIREVQKEIRRARPELLVVATRHRSTVDRMMRAGVGNDGLRSNDCDILITPLP